MDEFSVNVDLVGILDEYVPVPLRAEVPFSKKNAFRKSRAGVLRREFIAYPLFGLLEAVL